jgi:hypothetical protein
MNEKTCQLNRGWFALVTGIVAGYAFLVGLYLGSI